MSFEANRSPSGFSGGILLGYTVDSPAFRICFINECCLNRWARGGDSYTSNRNEYLTHRADLRQDGK